MKITAVLLAVVAACIGVAGSAAAPNPVALPQVSVPAEVVAAHPGGVAASGTAAALTRPSGTTPSAGERITCWRQYITGDNSGFWGTEQEYENPLWCGNGSVVRSMDASWHGQSCNWFVACTGETGIQTWYGCANGCASLGQQIVGHFRVETPVLPVTVDETVIWEVYGNGQWWSYTYHN